MFHSQNLLSFGLYFSALSSLMFCGKYVGSFQPLPATFFQSGTTFSQSRIFVAFILTISIFRSMSLISWTMSFISLAASFCRLAQALPLCKSLSLYKRGDSLPGRLKLLVLIAFFDFGTQYVALQVVCINNNL